ncbi:MAG: ferritin-like domain-containing protein [Acidobacteria bacterium]|nr:ferritin-like domain-containing protein [Acidobacteriota bacterium]
MNKAEVLHDLVESEVSRRAFAKRTIGAGLWAGGAAMMMGSANSVQAQSVTDVDILNFALNLEYLEAEFYYIATTGRRIADAGISVTGTGQSGATTGGGRVALDERTRTVADHITLDELQHVRFLRTALGSAAVAKPAINLEALGIGFRSQNEFLTLARAFEDLGVSAYGGAAAAISSRAILERAARIALTEAQHAGVLRLLVSDNRVVVPALDGIDVLPLMSPGGRLFQVDGDGLSNIRTPAQVLAVGGAFFPNGVNGNIR